jgi:hypothetical protein
LGFDFSEALLVWDDGNVCRKGRTRVLHTGSQIMESLHKPSATEIEFWSVGADSTIIARKYPINNIFCLVLTAQDGQCAPD